MQRGFRRDVLVAAVGAGDQRRDSEKRLNRSRRTLLVVAAVASDQPFATYLL